MYTLRKVLAEVIRKGEVTVNVPEVDMKELRNIVYNEAQTMLNQVAYVVYDEELTDGEKIATLQDILEQWERA